MHSIAHPPVAPALSFSFDDQQLRVVMLDDEPWFVVSDVCAVLGIKNPSDALKSLDEDEIKLFKDPNTLALSEGNRVKRGNPTFNLTSESGFYTLILRCRDAIKPGSMPHRVRRWVTGEVLPSIRKTGGYSVKKQVPRDRQIGRCQALMRDIERSDSKFCRDGLIALAGLAFADLGLDLPDIKGLRPLQMPITSEGGAA
jgi:prophage antirepressor-like protein